MPLTNFTSFELKPNKFSAPWLPEISMTVRFRPVGNDEINLLRMQVAEVIIKTYFYLNEISSMCYIFVHDP